MVEESPKPNFTFLQVSTQGSVIPMNTGVVFLIKYVQAVWFIGVCGKGFWVQLLLLGVTLSQ